MTDVVKIDASRFVLFNAGEKNFYAQEGGSALLWPSSAPSMFKQVDFLGGTNYSSFALNESYEWVIVRENVMCIPELIPLRKEKKKFYE